MLFLYDVVLCCIVLCGVVTICIVMCGVLLFCDSVPYHGRLLSVHHNREILCSAVLYYVTSLLIIIDNPV